MATLVRDFVYFLNLSLLALILAKGFLTAYRIATRQWPTSVRYLLRIVNWEIEALKILILVLFAFLLSLFKSL